MGDAVNTDSQGSLSRSDAVEKVAREIRTCPTCGARFSATAEHESCPVCLLRGAREEAVESDESVCEKTVEPAPGHATRRFEHYEVTLGEDGRPLELGRGAMGITYKAADHLKQRLMKRLNVRDRMDLLRFAIREGLVK